MIAKSLEWLFEVLEVGDSRRRSDGRDRSTFEREKRETMRRAQSKNNPSKSSEDTKEKFAARSKTFLRSIWGPKRERTTFQITLGRRKMEPFLGVEKWGRGDGEKVVSLTKS